MEKVKEGQNRQASAEEQPREALELKMKSLKSRVRPGVMEWAPD